mmetsp:Transcript_147334/g.257095  ORF Transcript_147334/g.257095 Transcript_147334/m.257095 type:complete len:238 (-) Transcript_147334:498-1211(-)
MADRFAAAASALRHIVYNPDLSDSSLSCHLLPGFAAFSEFVWRPVIIFFAAVAITFLSMMSGMWKPSSTLTTCMQVVPLSPPPRGIHIFLVVMFILRYRQCLLGIGTPSSGKSDRMFSVRNPKSSSQTRNTSKINSTRNPRIPIRDRVIISNGYAGPRVSGAATSIGSHDGSRSSSLEYARQEDREALMSVATRYSKAVLLPASCLEEVLTQRRLPPPSHTRDKPGCCSTRRLARSM